MRDTLLTMFEWNRGQLVGHLYPGSKLTGAREPVGQTALPRMWDTGETSFPRLTLRDGKTRQTCGASSS